MYWKHIRGVSAALAPLLTSCPQATAHPVPDVPVHTALDSGGSITITVELDTRCLAEDPETAPYLFVDEFDLHYGEADRQQILEKAWSFLPATLEFEFKPGGKVIPAFDLSFIEKEGSTLEETEDVVFVSAAATFAVPADATAYRVHAIDRGYLTVLCFNALNGETDKRFQALFPGETSRWLDLGRDEPRRQEAGSGGPGLSPVPLVVGATLALLLLAALLHRFSPQPRT